ncbi:hypothetical protein [Treponema sp.]|uniref:hypothetical protein n=1 Tax=Treponema sp. TaxID=166 RepID=UPI003F0CA701
MAKKLNIITAGGNLPFANNGLKLSENILIEKIEEHEKFKSLFSIDKTLLDRIAADMAKNSFDSSQPVHIWVTRDENGTEHNYLIDGYTRVAASRMAGIKMVPYFKHTFESFEEAHRYALHLQTDRRNLNGIDLLKNIQELMGSEYIQSLEGNKNEAVGKELGLSEKTVERANKVNSRASDEQIERIEKGEASPNQIYNEIINQETVDEEATDEQRERIESGEATVKDICKEIKAEKKSRKASKKKPSDDDISESLSTNEGTPAGLNFNHSDGIERPSYRLSPEEDSERTKERKAAYEAGLKKGSALAYEIYDFILSEIESGKSAEEIRNDIHFDDFSVARIYRAFNLDDGQKQEKEHSDSENDESDISDFDDAFGEENK